MHVTLSIVRIKLQNIAFHFTQTKKKTASQKINRNIS